MSATKSASVKVHPEKLLAAGWTCICCWHYPRRVPVSLWNWVTLGWRINLIGVGTNLKFYILSTVALYYDVTPIRKLPSTLNNNPFVQQRTAQQRHNRH
jgi:hypothetical protein